MSGKIPLKIGESVSFSKTVGETDVYMFAGISGDFSQNHINEDYMKKTIYKKRIAHGVLSIGYASTASTLMLEKTNMATSSYGYDRIRFIKPVFIGDTVTVKYTISEIDEETLKTKAKVEVFNQNGDLCTVAVHIVQFFL